MDYAADLARAIEAAARGEQESEPKWYEEFIRQYEKLSGDAIENGI